VQARLVALVAEIDLKRLQFRAADRRKITDFKAGQGGVHSSFSG
jgi:hypothetical protein